MGSYIQNHVFKICLKISWNYQNRDFRCKNQYQLIVFWSLTSRITIFCGPAFSLCSQFFKNVILDVRIQKSCIGSGFLHLKSRLWLCSHSQSYQRYNYVGLPSLVLAHLVQSSFLTKQDEMGMNFWTSGS